MRKASKIILLICAVLGIISALGLLVSTILMFVFASPGMTEQIQQMIADGTIHSSYSGTPEEVTRAVQFTFLIVGIVLLVVLVFEIPLIVLDFVGYKKESSGLFIAIIILSIMSGSILNIIGGVLGLIPEETKIVK